MMHIWPDCMPCILKMSIEYARMLMEKRQDIEAFMQHVLSLPVMRGVEWNVPSAEIVTEVWERVVLMTNDEDPARKIKAEQNRRALGFLGTARDQVLQSADPFLSALKFAIMGNSIDHMVGLRSDFLVDGVREDVTSNWVVTEDGAELLRDRLAEATSIVYLLDNCGEIVFDKLFIELLKDIYNIRVSAVVRGRPILNDATMAEATSVGLDKVTEVVENGIPRPYAGTRMDLVSGEVRRLLADADLVISKGVANFETLWEDRELDGRISFLFHGKCLPCCAPRNVPVGTLIVDNH